MSSVALTDFNNLFAFVKFYQAALKNGIKPIIGVEAQIAGKDLLKIPNSRVVFLCKNNHWLPNTHKISYSQVILKVNVEAVQL